jgi:hypothetical protein
MIKAIKKLLKRIYTVKNSRFQLPQSNLIRIKYQEHPIELLTKTHNLDNLLELSKLVRIFHEGQKMKACK